MKQLSFALAFLVAFAASAQAADPYNPEVPSESYDAPVYAFTGFGLGIDGGGQFTAIQINNPDGPEFFDGIAADGLIGGAHLEYLFAVDRFRLGAYAEGGFSNVNTEASFDGFDGDVLVMDHYYGAGLKAGATVYGNTLLFARFGYDWSQWSSDLGEGSADVGAWLIGGGIETMASDDWSLGLGVDYLLLHSADVEDFDATPFVDESEAIRAKVRLTRRF